MLAKLSQILERKVEKVREEERGQRQDLHVLATSYSGQLKARAASMIRESDFHHVGDKAGKAQEASVTETTEKVSNGIVSSKEATNGETKLEKEQPTAKESSREKRTASNQTHQLVYNNFFRKLRNYRCKLIYYRRNFVQQRN